ncbi:MAG: peptidase M14, partial [Alsobacter sp.]
MTQILALSLERTLDRLVAVLSGPGFSGSQAELWVFEDLAARRDAETRLAQAGVQARVRSAYQPLVHALLDEIDLKDAMEVVIRFPVAAVGPPLRFRAEAYPAPALVGSASVTYAIGHPGLDYSVEVRTAGRPMTTTAVFAPNRVEWGAAALAIQ